MRKITFFRFFGNFVPEPVSPEPFGIEAAFLTVACILIAMLCAFNSVLKILQEGSFET